MGEENVGGFKTNRTKVLKCMTITEKENKKKEQLQNFKIFL